jgi:hypothetical protein
MMMSNLKDETGYQFAMLDIKNAIDTYGIEILAEALSEYIEGEVDLDLTNILIPDTMYVQ